MCNKLNRTHENAVDASTEEQEAYSSLLQLHAKYRTDVDRESTLIMFNMDLKAGACPIGGSQSGHVRYAAYLTVRSLEV